MSMSNKPVVVVAMSGGVDSSVTAALLVERGYKVIGMMLNLWSEPGIQKSNRCCNPDSVALARQVSSILSIPFYVLDAKQIFYDSVVHPFIDDYTHNLTPNPCIYCNREIRWNFLFNHALAAGADFLATGHYARIIQPSEGSIQLLKGVDSNKDQSYVLHILTQEKLEHALFPLGVYTKPEVRQLAHKFNLPVAERKDSQDLCFLGGHGDYRQFLAQHAKHILSPGLIMDRHGTLFGHHQGLANFTIGQRKGLRISSPAPLYVVEKDLESNTLIVGNHEDTGRYDLIARNVNWIDGNTLNANFLSLVKIRYKAREIPCKVSVIDNRTMKIGFDTLVYDITPGQAAVLYNGDICLGGGIISC